MFVTSSKVTKMGTSGASDHKRFAEGLTRETGRIQGHGLEVKVLLLVFTEEWCREEEKREIVKENERK